MPMYIFGFVLALVATYGDAVGLKHGTINQKHLDHKEDGEMQHASPSAQGLGFALHSAARTKLFSSMSMQLQMRIANTWMAPDVVGDEDPAAILDIKPWKLRSFKLLAKENDHKLERRRLVLDLWQDKFPITDFNALVTGYAKVYRDEFAARDAVFFSHISKSAGNAMCMCGWDSGCKAWGAESEDDQCHARGPGSAMDVPAWGGVVTRPASLATCNGAAVDGKAVGAFVQSQTQLIRQGKCHHFWNVIVMRHPIDRLVSHLSHLHELDDKLDQDWSNIQVGSFWEPSEITMNKLFQTVPLITNNYYIRNLLGPKGYQIPLFGVNQTHLEEAKRILEDFDLVFIKSKHLNRNVQRLMGWRCVTETFHPGHTEDFLSTVRETWSPEAWSKIADANALDIELYKHALMLNKMDMEVFESPYFSLATSVQCPSWSTNATCGYLCK